MATTLDGETLFITNLNDHQIYGIDVSDPTDTTPPVWRVSTPVGANQQLWALTVHSGGSTWAMSTRAPAPAVRRRHQHERVRRVRPRIGRR